MQHVIDKLDVICQHSADGSIIPLRIRFTNEDGERQTLTIENYRQILPQGAYTTKDGLFICESTTLFECQIIVNNCSKIVRLYYEPKTSGKWLLGIT